MSLPIFISALGLSTPASGDQHKQVTTLLSGEPLFARHPKWIGNDGMRQVMGYVPELRDVSDFPQRVAMLLHRAFMDCKNDQQAHHKYPEPAPLIILVPKIMQHPDLRDSFQSAVAERDFPGVSDLRFTFGCETDAARVIKDLELDESQPHIYFAAADSLVSPFMLDVLAVQNLLRNHLTPWNPIPAEGAACLFMSRQSGFAQVQACAMAQEGQNLFDPNRNLLGRALCTAIDQVLFSDEVSPTKIITDANTERWRAEELGVVKSERPSLCQDGVSWLHIGQRAGDMGTATALISIIVACYQEKQTLILSSARSGDRAAVIIKTV